MVDISERGEVADARAGIGRVTDHGSVNKSAIGTWSNEPPATYAAAPAAGHGAWRSGRNDGGDGVASGHTARTLTWDQGMEMRNTCRSPPPPIWTSTSAIRTLLGNAARTRTRMGFCASTSPKARTFPATTGLPRVRRRAAQPPARQTTRLADTRGGARPTTLRPIRTTRCCVDRLNPPAMKCLYLAIMSLDPTGKGRKRWTNRWKAALNAFDITFDGRLSAGRN